ncbi:unnamed protein product, partial [marine sediment metagenome]
LTELEAAFIRHTDRGHAPVLDKDRATGVIFLCPACYHTNGGDVGTHRVICWSRSAGAPEDIAPGPGRWKMDGDDLAELTLNSEHPRGARSVKLERGCAWHGFITNGKATSSGAT